MEKKKRRFGSSDCKRRFALVIRGIVRSVWADPSPVWMFRACHCGDAVRHQKANPESTETTERKMARGPATVSPGEACFPGKKAVARAAAPRVAPERFEEPGDVPAPQEAVDFHARSIEFTVSPTRSVAASPE